jgi:hypothetical protein
MDLLRDVWGDLSRQSPKLEVHIEPIQIEDQLYTQGPSGYFGCALHQSRQSRSLISSRVTICHSGEIFRVSKLSFSRFHGLMCIPGLIFHCRKMNHLASRRSPLFVGSPFGPFGVTAVMDPSEFGLPKAKLDRATGDSPATSAPQFTGARRWRNRSSTSSPPPATTKRPDSTR